MTRIFKSLNKKYQVPFLTHYCSVLKYEFCMRYSLSIGFAIVPEGRESCALWAWLDCRSRFCRESVSEVPSSRWSKFVLSSNEMSELQKLSPECAGYASEKERNLFNKIFKRFLKIWDSGYLVKKLKDLMTF